MVRGILLLLLPAIISLTVAKRGCEMPGRKKYCRPDDDCWPTKEQVETHLNSHLSGAVYYEDTAEYSKYVRTKNGRVERKPTFMVLAKTPGDVQKAIVFARRFNISTAIQSSGHEFIGRSTCDDCMQINLGAMKDVSFNLVAGRNPAGEVTVQPGCSWKEIYKKVDDKGRVVVGGSAHTVSPSGYTLGGGHSPISRSLGLAVDNLLEVEMVSANGTLLRVDANGIIMTFMNGSQFYQLDKDLFWALRGGGGGTFGVVTAFTFKLHYPPSKIVKFTCNHALSYQDDDIGTDLMKNFTSLVANMPTKWGGYFILLGYPVGNEVFGPITFVLNHYGELSEEDRKYLDPIVKLCPVHNFTEYETFYAYELTIYDEEYTWLYSFNIFMTAKNMTDGWREFIFEQMRSQYNERAGFGCSGTLIGGQVKKVGFNETSVHPAFRQSDVSLTCVLWWDHEATEMENEYMVKKGRELNEMLQKFGNGSYVNEPAAHQDNWNTTFWGSNYERLLCTKKKWDPDHFFHCRQCVGSGGAMTTPIVWGIMAIILVAMTMM